MDIQIKHQNAAHQAFLQQQAEATATSLNTQKPLPLS
jgi:hypothetical protein